jgi:hypothetical protein
MNSSVSSGAQPSIVEAAAAIRAEANIGKLLQDAGKLKPQDLERVLTLQQKDNLRFGEAAQKLGLVTEDDIRQALSQQFEYPYIPAAEAGLSPQLVAATAPYGKEAEALRSLRSELQLRWFRDGRKTLAIGSARADEGASYLAANLAVLFAQMGRKVLLVDANMRSPQQQGIFKLDNSMGLSTSSPSASPRCRCAPCVPSTHSISCRRVLRRPIPSNCWRAPASARCWPAWRTATTSCSSTPHLRRMRPTSSWWPRAWAACSSPAAAT